MTLSENGRLRLQYDACGLQESGDLHPGSVVCRARADPALCGAETSYLGSHPFSTSRSPSSPNPLAKMHASTSCWTWAFSSRVLALWPSRHQRTLNQCSLVGMSCFGPHHWRFASSHVPRHRCRLGRWLFSNAASCCCSIVSSPADKIYLQPAVHVVIKAFSLSMHL